MADASAMTQGANSGWRFVNYGTFRKISASGVALIAANFHSTGTIASRGGGALVLTDLPDFPAGIAGFCAGGATDRIGVAGWDGLSATPTAASTTLRFALNRATPGLTLTSDYRAAHFSKAAVRTLTVRTSLCCLTPAHRRKPSALPRLENLARSRALRNQKGTYKDRSRIVYDLA